MVAVRNYILDEATANRKLRRMALELIENNAGETELILAGIEENGVVIAQMMARLIEELSSIRTRLITISMDKRNPDEITVSDQMPIDHKVLIVIDDVVSSGKTLLYALKPFLQSHPRKIQTMVLVERSHTSFPVRPDYTGLSISSTLQEHIYVEVDGERVTGAYLV